MLRALSVMSVRALFWLRPRCRACPCRRGCLCGVTWLPDGGPVTPPLLYALLTGFHAPATPSTRFGAARPREARTARLVGVFAHLGALRRAGGAIVGAISVA